MRDSGNVLARGLLGATTLRAAARRARRAGGSTAVPSTRGGAGPSCLHASGASKWRSRHVRRTGPRHRRHGEGWVPLPRARVRRKEVEAFCNEGGRSADSRVDGEVDAGEAAGKDSHVIGIESSADTRLCGARDLVTPGSEPDSVPSGGVRRRPGSDMAATREQECHVRGGLGAGLLGDADRADRAARHCAP
jgi:hypothetical protein